MMDNTYWSLSILESGDGKTLTFSKLQRDMSIRVDIPHINRICRHQGQLLIESTETSSNALVDVEAFLALSETTSVLECVDGREEFLILLQFLLERHGLPTVVEGADIPQDEIRNGTLRYKHKFSFETEVKIMRFCHPSKDSDLPLDASDKVWKNDVEELLRYRSSEQKSTVSSFFREARFVALLPKAAYVICLELIDKVKRGLIRGRPNQVNSSLFKPLVGCRDNVQVQQEVRKLLNGEATFQEFTENLVVSRTVPVPNSIELLRKENVELKATIVRLRIENESLKTALAKSNGERRSSLSTAYEEEDSNDVVLSDISSAIEDSDNSSFITDQEMTTRVLDTTESLTDVEEPGNALQKKVTAAIETFKRKRNGQANTEPPKVARKRETCMKETHDVTIGDRVRAKENDEWFDAKVLEVEEDRVYIHWINYNKSYDTWVSRKDIKRTESEHKYHVNDEVEVFERKYNTWYGAKVMSVNETAVTVQFNEYTNTQKIKIGKNLRPKI